MNLERTHCPADTGAVFGVAWVYLWLRYFT